MKEKHRLKKLFLKCLVLNLELFVSDLVKSDGFLSFLLDSEHINYQSSDQVFFEQFNGLKMDYKQIILELNWIRDA